MGIRLIAWLWLTNTPPDVAVAQLRELRRQVPLLYTLLTVSYTHLTLPTICSG